MKIQSEMMDKKI